MVSALDSGASVPCSSPGREHCVLRQGHFALTVPLSTQVYKWVPANCLGKPNKLLGSDPAMV